MKLGLAYEMQRPLQFLIATETIPHEKVMSSIELFGKYVIPALNNGK